jgi:cell division protease FtsH
LGGPPGTGKTLLASALARSAQLPFISTSVASWFVASDGHLGGVLQAADSFFQALRAAAPVIGFLDELEAIPDRASLEPRHREWWNPVVTGLLLSVSSIRSGNSGVILLGATNFIDRIDDALKRPGRFGRHVLVRGPENQAEVAEVLHYYAGADLSSDDVDYAASLVGTTTPAAVEGWMASARRLARQASRKLTVDDLVLQVAPHDRRSKADQLRFAIHECGHAVVALALGLNLVSVSVIRDGDTGGTTLVQGQLVPRLADIEARVITTLAGRAADQVIGGGGDVGSVHDLEVATRVLAAARASHGLRDSLVHRSAEADIASLMRIDPHLVRQVDEDLQRLMAQALKLVEQHRDAIVKLAHVLVERRFLTGAHVQAALGANSDVLAPDPLRSGNPSPKAERVPNPGHTDMDAAAGNDVEASTAASVWTAGLGESQP